MIILLHIIIAVLSMGHATFVYIKPTTGRLRATYVLAALTMASGFYLVFAAPARIAETCVLGLVYLAVVSFGIAGAVHKLAVERAINKER
jgi:hypothetical protein